MRAAAASFRLLRLPAALLTAACDDRADPTGPGESPAAENTRNYADVAFALANQPTGTNYSPGASASWNPAGTSTVVRSGVGQYRVTFNGLSAQLPLNVLGHV